MISIAACSADSVRCVISPAVLAEPHLRLAPILSSNYSQLDTAQVSFSDRETSRQLQNPLSGAPERR